MARARVVASCYDLHRAAQAALIQHYAIKLAGLTMYLRGAELAAALAKLQMERDAAIAALRQKFKSQEQATLALVERKPVHRLGARSQNLTGTGNLERPARRVLRQARPTDWPPSVS